MYRCLVIYTISLWGCYFYGVHRVLESLSFMIRSVICTLKQIMVVILSYIKSLKKLKDGYINRLLVLILRLSYIICPQSCWTI